MFCLVIDFHSHIFTEEALKNAPKGMFSRYEEVFHKKWEPTILEKIVQDMDEAKVDKAVVVAIDAETTLNYKIPNEVVAEAVKKYPDRFIGFASVDPHKGVLAVKELEKAVKELGLKGLKLVPFMINVNLNDKILYPLYEKAQELDIPVLAHTGVMFDVGTRMKYCKPLDVDDVAVDFPDLKIVVAHFGWPWVDEAMAVCQKNRNVYFDIAGWSPKYLPESVVRFMGGMLADKALFATDYPLLPRKRVLNEFLALPIKEEAKKKILEENAKKLLKL